MFSRYYYTIQKQIANKIFFIILGLMSLSALLPFSSNFFMERALRRVLFFCLFSILFIPRLREFLSMFYSNLVPDMLYWNC